MDRVRCVSLTWAAEGKEGIVLWELEDRSVGVSWSPGGHKGECVRMRTGGQVSWFDSTQENWFAMVSLKQG